MAVSPQRTEKAGECREIIFWLLLLGSWQLLMAPGPRNAALGGAGTAAFLLFAHRHLGRLTGLGLSHACWQPATGTRWRISMGSGLVAGGITFAVGSALGHNMMLDSDFSLVLLQVTLGPALEEIVFRGYCFALLFWSLRKVASGLVLRWLVIVTAAVVFAVVHLARPGVGWLQLACISVTGALYGWIRFSSGSTAPAALSHAVYNLTLHAAAAVKAMS